VEGGFILRNDVFETVRYIMQVIGVVLLIMITIGFFYTPFESGRAVVLSEELVNERRYVERMQVQIREFTEKTLEVKEINEQANQGRIVPMRVAQNFSTIFQNMSDDYNELSFIEVPERFRQFHVVYLQSMALKGASLNQILTYLEDKDPRHLATIENYNTLFVRRYNEAVNLFNRLVSEKPLR